MLQGRRVRQGLIGAVLLTMPMAVGAAQGRVTASAARVEEAQKGAAVAAEPSRQPALPTDDDISVTLHPDPDEIRTAMKDCSNALKDSGDGITTIGAQQGVVKFTMHYDEGADDIVRYPVNSDTSNSSVSWSSDGLITMHLNHMKLMAVNQPDDVKAYEYANIKIRCSLYSEARILVEHFVKISNMRLSSAAFASLKSLGE